MRGVASNASRFALTKALSLAEAHDCRKQASHAVRVDKWLCEYRATVVLFIQLIKMQAFQYLVF